MKTLLATFAVMTAGLLFAGDKPQAVASKPILDSAWQIEITPQPATAGQIADREFHNTGDRWSNQRHAWIYRNAERGTQLRRQRQPITIQNNQYQIPRLRVY